MDEYPVPDLGDIELIDLLNAVADPTRLHIVQQLADGEEHPKSAGLWGVDVQKSTLSHHFKTLRESGFTRTIVHGRTHTIQLRREELDARFPGLVAALVAGVTPADPARPAP